jgi:signal peptidase II
MRPPRLSITVAAGVVLIDAVSKAVVAHTLTPGRVVPAGPLLKLDLYYNHAGAGNALTGRPVLVTVLSILACAALAVMAARARSRGMSVGLGLLLGGGLGNLADRLFSSPGPFRGGVIDWLRPLHSSGSMNLADVSINLGVLVLGLTLAAQAWSGRKVPGPTDRAPSPA